MFKKYIFILLTITSLNNLYSIEHNTFLYYNNLPPQLTEFYTNNKKLLQGKETAFIGTIAGLGIIAGASILRKISVLAKPVGIGVIILSIAHDKHELKESLFEQLKNFWKPCGDIDPTADPSSSNESPDN